MAYNEIEIEGKRFAVEGDFNFEFYSPFIDAEEINIQGESINPRGNLTQPITIIGSPELAEITKQAQLLQSKNPTVTFTKCVLRSKGVVVARGNVDITKIPRNLNTHYWKCEGLFYEEAGSFRDVVADKSIRDLVLCGDIQIVGSPITGQLSSLEIHFGTDFNFFPPPNDPPYFDVTRGNDAWSYLYHLFPDGFQNTSRYAGLILGGVEPDPGDELYNAYLQGIGYFVFPCYKCEFERSDSESLHKIFNHYGGPSGKYNAAYNVDMSSSGTGNEYVHYTPLRNQIVPMFYYHQVLRHCFSEFGYTLQGNLLEDSQFLKLVLPNTYSILKEEILQIDNFLESGQTVNALYGQDTTYIKPKNHLPDMPVLDFIRDFMLRFNVYFSFEGTTVTIKGNNFSKPGNSTIELSPEVVIEHQKKRGVQVQYNFPTDDASYETQRNLQTVIDPAIVEDVDGSILSSLNDGDLYLQQNYNAINRKDSSLGAGFEFEVNNLVKYETGTEKKFSSDIVPVEMGVFNYNPNKALYEGVGIGWDALLPWFSHEPTYYSLKIVSMKWDHLAGSVDEIHLLDWGEWILNEGKEEKKIALYHGLQETVDTDTFNFAYPYMSFHNYAPGATGDVKLGDWHLGWLGDEGLIDTFWKEFINVFNVNRKVTFRCYPHWNHIRTHDWQSTIIFRGVKYYVSAIKFSMPGLLNKQPVIYECWEL